MFNAEGFYQQGAYRYVSSARFGGLPGEWGNGTKREDEQQRKDTAYLSARLRYTSG